MGLWALGDGCCVQATAGCESPGPRPPALAVDLGSWRPLIWQVGPELSSHLFALYQGLQRPVHTLMSPEVCSLLILGATYTKYRSAYMMLRSTASRELQCPV